MTRNLILSGVAALVAGCGLFLTSGTAQAQFPGRLPIQTPGIRPLNPIQTPGIRPGFPGPTPGRPGYVLGYSRIDRLALQLKREAEQLHEEVHLHFRRTPQYRHLDQDVRDIERDADHIHDLVGSRASLRHLLADMRDLDRLIDHVQELVRDMARYRELDLRAYYHLRQSLRQVEYTLHRLHDEIHD